MPSNALRALNRQAQETQTMFSAPQYGLGRVSQFQTPQQQASNTEEARPSDWPLTHHAKARVRQRGVRYEVLDMLLDWGTVYHCGHGSCDMVLFRKRDVDKLIDHLPKAERLAIEKQRRLFAVLGRDNQVVTVGHRSRHTVRH